MFDRSNENFLWYVDFGITKTQAIADKNTALEKCINKAYEDSCRHIDYLYSVSELDSMKKKSSSDIARDTAIRFEDHKECFKTKCTSIIRNCIQELLSNNTVDYDSWHRNLCTGEGATDLRLNDIPPGLFTNDAGLTIGQRQKWVNMSIKNMLVMGLWDNELLRYKDKIHVPIDDKIQERAKNIDVYTKLPAWNCIDNYDDYLRFQVELRDVLSTPPIIWEWDEWMK